MALLLAGLISCKEDDTVEPTFINNGEVSVLLNGEDFLSQFKAGIRAGTETSCFSENLLLFVDYYNEANIERMGFSVLNIPFEEGTYTVHRIEPPNQACSSDTVYANFGTTISDGDVNGDFYLPLEGTQNQITITSHNLLTREVQGRFDITFVIIDEHRQNKTVIDAPDTIRLTEGQFKVRYDTN